MTYYRIGDEMTAADCHRCHVSRLWSGEDDETRRGVSTCRSMDDLLEYFAGTTGTSVGRGADLRGAHLVALEGDESADDPWEPAGEALIHPTRVVSSEPISADLLAALTDRVRDEQCNCWADVRYDLAAGEWQVADECEWCDGEGCEDCEDGVVWQNV